MASLDPTSSAAALRQHLLALESTGDPVHAGGALASARTLSVWLRLLGRRALLDDLGWLAKGLAEIDEACALRSQARRVALQERIQPELERAVDKLIDVLSRPRIEGLLEALEHVPQSLGAEAERGASRLRAKALSALEAFTTKPGSRKRLQKLYRRARTVRIALELNGANAKTWSALESKLRAADLTLALDERMRELDASETDEPAGRSVRKRVSVKAVAAVEAFALESTKKLRAEVRPWTSG